MLEQIGVALPYGAYYTKAGLGQAGLTVTCTVYKLFAGTTLVSGAAATEVGGGLYRYVLAANLNDAEDIYVATFHTPDATVDQQDMEADYTVGKAGIEDLDARISSVIASIVPGAYYVLARPSAGSITLVRGDSYRASEGRSIDITDTGNLWPALTGTVTFLAGALSKACTILVGSGSGKSVRIELDSADTLALDVGHYTYQVLATEANAHPVTLEQGTLTVDRPHS